MCSAVWQATPDEDFIIDHHPKWQNIVIGAGFSGQYFVCSLIRPL